MSSMTGQSAAEGSPCSHKLSVQTQEDEQDRAESVLSRSVTVCVCVVHLSNDSKTSVGT